MDKVSILTELIALAHAQSRLTHGTLLTPPLVGAITGNPKEAQWVLSGSVSATMHALMKAGVGPTGSAVHILDLGTPRGFLVIAHQVAAHQHRFVVPMVGETLGLLVRSLQQNTLALYYGCEDLFEDHIEASSHLSDALITELQKAHRPLDEPAAVFEETLLMTAKMLQAGAVRPPKNLAAPGEICVTTIAPPELNAWAEQHLLRSHGGKANQG